MVELLCTLTGIIAGIAIVASLFQNQGNRQRFAAEASATESDRILGIADQLQVISHRVAADVSAHSEKVVHISDRLAAPTDEPEQFISTINEIITANQAMRGQLADAQKRIAQQSRMIEQASQQARTDALTGLANRRALNEFLANSIDNLSEGVVTGLLLMDIDRFKNFNDSFGHTTGDAVLASFARAIANCCGESSYAARFGGEEFAVVLSASSLQELVVKATEVRYFVSQQVINYEDLQLQITSSAGLCVVLTGDNCNTIYERADEGLYQSKKAGRDCGFWLSANGWLPFPLRAGEPKTLAELTKSDLSLDLIDSSAGLREAVAAPSHAQRAAQSINDGPQAAKPLVDFSMAPTYGPDADIVAGESTAADLEAAGLRKSDSDSTSNQENSILDLANFIDRLDAYLEQLHKADLPSTAFLIEVIGLKEADADEMLACWNEVVEVATENLRGIDVACLYRPQTLCIFLPGCSLEAGIGRAASLKAQLWETALNWPETLIPENFAMSVASAGPSEDSAHFLNRLELALEEAFDANARELVVHDGNTCQFQEV